MIQQYFHRDRNLTFYDNSIKRDNNNIYTVIVGKNGSGKSTLLGSLIRDILGQKARTRLFRESEIDIWDYDKNRLCIERKPEQIISVSTSPFDKFPLTRTREIDGYSYLGLRDLHSSNFGLAYLGKIVSSLIESVSKNPVQGEEIGKVLNYLGYHETLRMRFCFRHEKNIYRKIAETNDHNDLFKIIDNIPFHRLRWRLLNEDNTISIKKYKLLKYISNIILSSENINEFQIEISSSGISFDDYSSRLSESIPFLIQTGLVRLQDVGVQTLSDSSLFSIIKASSGEQSVILSILGIASRIQDNSLICIDEPEICLHPQWQEKYIQILINTFSNFKNCQFLIATHSPQIISRLNNKNCYILSLEHGLIHDASEFIHNSADFQLARLFDSPGFKNEYLSRIALNIFSRVSKRKLFNESDIKDYKLLEFQSNFLDNKDPVYELYTAIKELFEIYGGYKKTR